MVAAADDDDEDFPSSISWCRRHVAQQWATNHAFVVAAPRAVCSGLPDASPLPAVFKLFPRIMRCQEQAYDVLVPLYTKLPDITHFWSVSSLQKSVSTFQKFVRSSETVSYTHLTLPTILRV